MPRLNVQDCYWFVGGDQTKVYSSARNIYVDPEADAAYSAWRAVNGPPANLQGESEIWYYVQTFQPLWLWDGTYVSQPAAGQYRKTQLQNYNANARFNKVVGGMVANGVPVNTDDRSRGLISTARGTAIDNPSATFSWYGSDGNFYPLDSAGMIELAKEVGDHVNLCYSTFQQVDGGIAGGSITTLAAIDSAYSAFP